MLNGDTTSSKALNILLVEDNAAHAELLMRGFEDVQVPNRITHVLDGEQALDYLFRRGSYANRQDNPRPHVILLDLHLPRVDGHEVLRQVKASEDLRSIPVVVLTTSNTDQDVRRAYEEHTNSYVVKPLDFSGFLDLTGELATYWLERNHPAHG